MKIIAIEEAFSIEELGAKATGVDQTLPVAPDILRDWEKRLADILDLRIADMDEYGVAIQVLSLTAPGIQQSYASADRAVSDALRANDFLANAIAKRPDRFRGFAALPMQNPAVAAKELRRCIEELGFCGALINDHIDGHYMDEKQFGPVWSVLEELDAPLYIHPGAPKAERWKLLDGYPQLAGATWAWAAEVSGHAVRTIFGGVFDRHPRARLILGHMGEFLPFQLWRLDSRYKTMEQQTLQRLPSEYFKTTVAITTSGVFSPEVLKAAIEVLGEDSVLFAIDYPYESSRAAVDFLQDERISDAVRQKIAWSNAERILKIH